MVLLYFPSHILFSRTFERRMAFSKPYYIADLFFVKKNIPDNPTTDRRFTSTNTTSRHRPSPACTRRTCRWARSGCQRRRRWCSRPSSASRRARCSRPSPPSTVPVGEGPPREQQTRHPAAQPGVRAPRLADRGARHELRRKGGHVPRAADGLRALHRLVDALRLAIPVPRVKEARRALDPLDRLLPR